MSTVSNYSSFSVNSSVANELPRLSLQLEKNGRICFLRFHMHSTQSPQGLAISASSKDDAISKLQLHGYWDRNTPVLRKLDSQSGEGFWDTTVSDLRAVCYGPNEYVQPHFHDIDEVFTIRSGSCFVWISTDSGKNWDFSFYEAGKLTIPAGTWHCLAAGSDGLLMDVYRDQKRSIQWLDDSSSSSWSKQLTYPVAIEDLETLTRYAFNQ